MIFVRLIDRICDPETRFYEIKIKGGPSKFIRISEDDTLPYRCSLSDLLDIHIDEYKEQHKLSKCEVVFV